MLRLSTKTNILTPRECIGEIVWDHLSSKRFSAWLPHIYVATLCCRNTTKTALSWHSTEAIGNTHKHLIHRFIFTSITYGYYKHKVKPSPTTAYPTFKSGLP